MTVSVGLIRKKGDEDLSLLMVTWFHLPPPHILPDVYNIYTALLNLNRSPSYCIETKQEKEEISSTDLNS